MKDLPVRKSIRLNNYDYSQNGYYFVTICTHNKKKYFGEIVGATLCGRPNNPDKMILKWLLELERKFDGVKIDEYIVMPNHVHFIVKKTGDHAESPLQDIISWFKTMTTNEYIKNVKEKKYSPFEKSLWQRGYYEHIIRNEEEYIKIAKYIIFNVQKWADDELYLA